MRLVRQERVEWPQPPRRVAYGSSVSVHRLNRSPRLPKRADIGTAVSRRTRLQPQRVQRYVPTDTEGCGLSPEPKSLQRSTDRVVVDDHDAGEALDAAAAPHRLESCAREHTPAVSAAGRVKRTCRK